MTLAMVAVSAFNQYSNYSLKKLSLIIIIQHALPAITTSIEM
jgi:hypothetical protein